MLTWESLLRRMEDLLPGERTELKKFILTAGMEVNAIRLREKMLENH